MKETKDRLRTGAKTLRLAALALSLGAAGAASAADDVWTGAGSTTDWANTGNWNNAMAGGGNFVINTKGSDVTVTFAQAKSESGYWTDNGLWVENIAVSDGVDTTVTFTGDTDDAGLSIGSALTIGTEWGSGALSITKGDFYMGNVYIGSQHIDAVGAYSQSGGTVSVGSGFLVGNWNAGRGTATINGTASLSAGWLSVGAGANANGSTMTIGGSATVNSYIRVGVLQQGTLTVEGGTINATGFVFGSDAAVKGTLNATGGTVKTPSFTVGTTTGASGEINLNGGTLQAGAAGTLIGSGITVAIGANGGTIDVGANNVTIAAAVTGVGTITKKGTGTLTFTGDMSGFVGKVAVESGAGAVTLPATASRARTGDYTVVAENQDGTFTFTYDANGSAPVATQYATLLDLDFEDETTYASGWSLSGNGSYTQGTRTLASGATSKFLRSYTGTGSGDRRYQAKYTFSNAITTVEEYILEFDWFAAQNVLYSNTSLDLGLYISAGDEEIVKIIANPQTLSGNKAQIYLNGSDTPLSTTIDTAPGKTYSNDPSQDCEGTTNQDKWYHIVLAGNADNGVTFKMLDYQGDTTLEETYVCDFVQPTLINNDLNKRRGNFAAISGIDNLVVSTPATVKIEETSYPTLAMAVAAATSSSTITLYGDIELTSSVELPYGATLDLNGYILYTTDENVAVTFNDGVHYLESTTAGGFKTFTATVTMDDKVYIWTGNGDGSSWSDAQNWSLAGTAVVPAGDDAEVFFPADGSPWTVALSGAQTVKSIQFSGNTTLSGALIYASEITGDDGVVVTLDDDAGFGTYRALNSNLSIAVDIEAIGDASHPNKLDGYYTTKNGNPDQGGTNISFSGDLTGDGYLKIIGCRAYDTMSGDWSNFEGTIDIFSDRVSRHEVNLTGNCIGSAKAKWIAYTDDRKAFAQAGQTVYFGSLNGTIHQAVSYYNKVFEIGALNEDCSFGGAMGNSGVNSIRKVGTATLTFTGSHLGTAYIQGGTFVVGGVNSMARDAIQFTGSGVLMITAKDANEVYLDPSAVITGSTSAIAFDSNGDDYTWSSALASSNEGGLTKKGAGTLTLSAAPAYTGATSVEEGTLYIVDTYTPTLAAGTAEVASDKGGYKKYVAGNVAGGETMTVVAASAEAAAAMATVTPTAAQAAADVESSYYKVVATETSEGSGTYALTVEFADEVVPEVSEGTVNDTTVTFAVTNFKKGLYYGVAAGASPELGETGVTLTPCTDEQAGVPLTAAMPAEGVKYYKVVVSDTAE